MRTNLTKYFNDYEKEENWLNDMSRKGWNLVACSPPSYTFEESTDEYIYRITLLEHGVEHPESISTVRFLEESGAEHVTSFYRWAYFRKKATEGDFQIYTDAESKIKHYKRMVSLLFWIGLVQVIVLATQLPFIVHGIIFNNPWIAINAAVASANITLLAFVLPPFLRFVKRAKELEFEKVLFE